eukprot:CAMPEP_0195507344 /NCGR_PEP_ID=MMETSP0794_2-20130614/817_1 /TAXON_ID=515487 /ORGANISM="Stephanopyxis turris, Strain CCMP 815" /LENGTH=115 /DNA_ID=CAMNT_0040633993 /DNA_START=69 /DNA_END=416 /DNA_ORIENTATION=+
MKFAFLALGALVASIAPTAVTAAKSWDESRPVITEWYQKHKKGELTNAEIWTMVAEDEYLMMPDIRSHPESESIKSLMKLDKSIPVEEARKKMFLKLAELDVDPLWPPSVTRGEL